MKEKARIDWDAARARLAQAQHRLDSAEIPVEDRERIFRARAELLSRPEEPAGPDVEGQSIMVFRIGRERYAVPLASVSEVITGAAVAPVPGAPGRVAGVIQVRGEIRPALNLAHALGLSEGYGSDPATVLLFRRQGREVGLRTGPVEDIRTLGAAARRPAPETARHAVWMTADLVMVLNVDALVDEDV
jgi:purine-binding chemotaxis protein CheW